jgi:hypothetical protein
VFVGSCAINTKELNVQILGIPLIRRAKQEINQRGVDKMVTTISASKKVTAGVYDTVNVYKVVIESWSL